MSFWNILGGAAMGVATIAALPVAGAVGTVALGGGLIAAGLGATAGAIKNEMDEEEKRNSYERGKNKGKAESATEIENLTNKLEDAFSKLATMDEHWNALIAMEAVAVSLAAYDGDFSDNEKEEIQLFVHGTMTNSSIPNKVKEKVEDIYNNPPSIKEAFKLANKTNIPMSVFDDILYFVMHIDGVKNEEELFVNVWEHLKKTA